MNLDELHDAAIEADAAFQAALVAQYGKWAGDMRYSYDHPAHIAPLAAAHREASEAYMNGLREYRLALRMSR